MSLFVENVSHQNEIYNYMCRKFGIMSILDLRMKWHDVYPWLGKYPWLSRDFDIVSAYLQKKGIPTYA